MASIILTQVSDQAFDPELWERLGIGEGWDRLTAAFDKLGAEVIDDQDITITMPARNVAKVRQLIERARSGEFGEDVQSYWRMAKEGGR